MTYIYLGEKCVENFPNRACRKTIFKKIHFFTPQKKASKLPCFASFVRTPPNWWILGHIPDQRQNILQLQYQAKHKYILDFCFAVDRYI